MSWSIPSPVLKYPQSSPEAPQSCLDEYSDLSWIPQPCLEAHQSSLEASPVLSWSTPSRVLKHTKSSLEAPRLVLRHALFRLEESQSCLVPPALFWSIPALIWSTPSLVLKNSVQSWSNPSLFSKIPVQFWRTRPVLKLPQSCLEVPRQVLKNPV